MTPAGLPEEKDWFEGYVVLCRSCGESFSLDSGDEALEAAESHAEANGCSSVEVYSVHSQLEVTGIGVNSEDGGESR